MTTSKIQDINSVDRVICESQKFKLVSREFKSENTILRIGTARIGSKELTIIAGPCAVENERHLMEAANAVKSAGAKLLRGGAFKPRSSCYSFQGLGEDGLNLLEKAREETGLPIVTEVTTSDKVKIVAKHADVLQIGARNMQNFDLLSEAGRSGKPVLLKRGMTATIEEFLMAAEYVMSEGNDQIILCERGIRTFEPMTRNTADISAIPLLKKLSHLPVIFDPSHACGKRELVIPMAKAAIAAGADGIIVEVHPEPEKALCDGKQSLTLEGFNQMMKELRKLAPVLGRKL